MEHERVRRVSRALFGHRYRLELLTELAEAKERGVCVSDLAVQRNAKSSVYYPPLRQLESVGLVRRKPDASRGRRVYYMATRDSAWAAITRLVRAVQAADPVPAAEPGERTGQHARPSDGK